MTIQRLTIVLASALAVISVALCGQTDRASAAVTLIGAVPEEYNYDVSWRTRDRLLTGTGRIRVRNDGPSAIDHVWLRLRPNRGDELERVTWVANARLAEKTADRSMVRLNLIKPLAPGAMSTISFGFNLRVPRENTSLGRSAGIDLFGDALPVLAVGGLNGPRIGPEPAYGEGSLNPMADWGVSFRVPRGLRVMAPGDMSIATVTNRGTFYSTSLEARDFAFAVGHLRTVSHRVGGMTLSVTGTDATRAQLKPALRRAVAVYRTLLRSLGVEPPSYWIRVIIGDLPFGGSEYSGIVFSTPDIATIAHELAHQWFYGVVGNDQYNQPFLDESLTAYTEQRFHKSYRCDLAKPIRGRHGLGTGMKYWQRHPAAYQDTIYRGGACALTALRRDIGPTAFDQALRSYVDANAWRIAGINDFLAAIREAAPTYDLARWQRLVGLD